ncbi:MAG TPA: Holliday junction resolvase RuvX [Candidatus Paceibacterota bacterium]
MRYLGIDYGTRKVGLALSDEAGTMGFPKGIVPNAPSLAADIADLIAREGVDAVVIGESLDFQGNENPVARQAKAFALALAHKTDVPIAWEPEMLTTREARRGPGQADEKPDRRPRDHAPVDASAAALILTSYLTKQQNTHT